MNDQVALLGFIDQTLYANRGSSPAVTWRNDEVLELLEDVRRLAASQPVQVEPTDEMVKAASESLGIHRWKSMGVSSVECECGEIVKGADDLTGFPADVAFRNHLARAALTAALGGGE